MPTHAIRQHGHQGALATRVGKYRSAVLLLGTITSVLGHAGLGLIAFLGTRGFGIGQG